MDEEKAPDDFIAGNFVKVYGSIVTSSVWVEKHHVFKVWMLFLAMADAQGRVVGTVPGLANIACVTIPEFEEAISKFMAPDPHSRSKNDEGRRIVEIDGGWRIINHKKYRELRTEKQVQDAQRQARHRLRDKRDTSHESRIEAEVEAEAKGETDQKPTTPTSETAEQTDVRLKQVMQALHVPGDLSTPWERLLLGMREGLGAPSMKPLPWDVLLEAAQELDAAGGDVTPSRYKAFVGKVLNRKDREADGGPQYSTRGNERKGYTLAAADLINKVREAMTVIVPATGEKRMPPDWAKGFSEGELRVIKALKVSRFRDESNESALLAQVGRAMQEAGL